MIFFFVRTFSSILPYNISLCQRDSECTRGKNQLEIKTILHRYLLLQSGRNPCILTTNIKSVEWIVYRVTTNAVFKGNFVFPFGIRYIYSHSTITIKIAISVKNVFFFFFYRQTVFNTTLFPLRHIFHVTQQIQWKLQFMLKKTTTKKPLNCRYRQTNTVIRCITRQISSIPIFRWQNPS